MGSSTTRRLIVLRHAKSDQHSEAPTDHERPLNPRGIRSAPLVAQRLREMGWVPEAVISSDALRTRQTWEHMQPILGDPRSLRFTRELYLAGLGEIQAAVSELPDTIGRAMVIGHNPGWEEAVYQLSGVHVRVTTCNAMLLEIEADTWAEAIERRDWRLDSVLRPKEL